MRYMQFGKTRRMGKVVKRDRKEGWPWEGQTANYRDTRRSVLFRDAHGDDCRAVVALLPPREAMEMRAKTALKAVVLPYSPLLTVSHCNASLTIVRCRPILLSSVRSNNIV